MPSFKKKKKRPGFKLADIRNVATLNIGTILFGALFIYMVISIILYLTATHITSYQVTSGPLSKNQTYTALAVREEVLVQSSASGYISYYASENSKVKAHGAVFSIGSSTTSSDDDDTTVTLTEDQLSDIRSSIAKFANSFNSNNFLDTYSFKYDLEGDLLSEYVSEYSGDSGTVSATIGDETVYFSDETGIVQFTKDGYEDVTIDNFTTDDFNQKSYAEENLRTDEISIGDDVYKLITSEEWSIIVPLTSSQAVSLEGKDTIRVCFLKDNISQNGNFSMVTTDDGNYAVITFTNGMLRYASDRFLEIELVTNTYTGLKIPLSSIVNKDFYVIPEGYETTGGDSDETGFLLDTSEAGDGSSTEFVSATIYASEDGYYYIDMSTFDDGDVIIMPDSELRYTIGATKALEGVYCINKGYAQFRRVVITDQNEEYCIVESGTDYGIAQFDNIVYDSTTVDEDEILF